MGWIRAESGIVLPPDRWLAQRADLAEPTGAEPVTRMEQSTPFTHSTGAQMSEFPKLLEKLGADGVEELRQLVAEEVARRADRQPTPPAPTRPGIPGPDEDLRPRG
jgi:hypothetical protein